MSVRERRVRDNPPYLETERQRFGWRERHLRVSGLGSRASGTGYRVRVRVRVLNLTLVLNT